VPVTALPFFIGTEVAAASTNRCGRWLKEHTIMLLTESIDRLAQFEPVPFPVLSLYLDMRPNGTGRDQYAPFLRKAFRDRLRTYRPHSPEHTSFSRDVERITAYLESEVRASANGLALFACAGADDFFEAIQLDVPIEFHRLYVDDKPHLYPLARIDDQYPRFAAVVLDTNLARIFVFSTGQRVREQQVQSPKTKQVKVGGWSQARYQRHIEQYHQQHVKEVIDQLDRVVRADNIERIVVAGDEVVVPLLKKELTPALADRVVDIVRLDIAAPDREVLETTLGALRRRDAETDAQVVDQLLNAVRGDGLGVVGPHDTLEALGRGQVDELVMTARPDVLTNVDQLVTGAASVGSQPSGNAAKGLAAVDDAAAAARDRSAPLLSAEEQIADRLVTLARQTAARSRFIEDPALLAEVGGVGAFLRFRV
jgi:peptide chain release factor subunit 1